MNDEIEWLNSLDIQSCSLVSSAEDLKSGVVLCDLVAYLKSRPLFEDVLRHSEVQKNFKKASLNNFKIFLREIGSKLPHSLMLTPESYCLESDLLLDLVKFLQKMLAKPKLNLKKIEITNKAKNFTPRGRILISPQAKTPKNRLNHSPSMIDIHVQSRFSENFKENIFNWLKDLKLIKEGSIEELKDGVVMCELINRLEGKSEVIKGMHKFPKNKSAIQVNVNKALSYLRNIEKFSSDFLWSANEIIEGDEECIFGLFSSIKEFYSGKRASSKTSRKSPRLFKKVFQPVHDNEIVEKSCGNTKNWVKNLGLGKLLGHEKKHFLDDPVRNGILLAEVISKLEAVEVPGINIPKTLTAAQGNFEKSLKFIYDKYPSLSLTYLRLIDEIINGDSEVFWKLITELITIPRNFSKITSELPYTSEEITLLQDSILNWASLHCNKNYEDFEALIKETQTGVVLYEILNKTGLQVMGITKNPKTDKIKLANIEKCLDALRKVARMSQKFLWKTTEILEGNNSVIIGLFEDLHRFSDGLPARKRGPNYHSDGPYLGKPQKKVVASISPIRNLSSRLNKSFESPHNTSRQYREDIVPEKKRNEDFFLGFSNEFDWIYDLGLQIQPIDFSANEIEELKSGVLLCQIVEKLERKSLSGVELKPRSNAVALYNIGKALKVLKSKPTFPSCLMFVEEDIVKGKGESVRELLRATAKIYKQTIRSYNKFKNLEKGNMTYIG